MKVEYTKVDVNDATVVTLAKQMNATPKEVAAVVNQQRYRSAYNKLNQAKMKVMRQLVKAHPELLNAQPTPTTQKKEVK